MHDSKSACAEGIKQDWLGTVFQLALKCFLLIFKINVTIKILVKL